MTGSTTTALIMAAGEGTRMRSTLPKVLHPVCGRPMIAWPILAARAAGVDRVAVIVSPNRDLGDALPGRCRDGRPAGIDGTGGAVRAGDRDRRASPAGCWCSPVTCRWSPPK